MARTKVAKKSARAKADIAASGSASSSAQSSTPNYAPSELLDKAEAILARAGPDCLDLARKFATRASKLLSENGQYDAVQQARAGEVLGMCCLEEGDENGAREVCRTAYCDGKFILVPNLPCQHRSLQRYLKRRRQRCFTWLSWHYPLMKLSPTFSPPLIF